MKNILVKLWFKIAPLLIPIGLISFFVFYVFDYKPSVDDINFSKKAAIKNFNKCFVDYNITDEDILKKCIKAEKNEINDILKEEREKAVNKNIPAAKKLILKLNKLVDEVSSDNFNFSEYFIVASDDVDNYDFFEYSLEIGSKIAFRAKLHRYQFDDVENVIEFEFLKNIWGEEDGDIYNSSVNVNIKNLSNSYTEIFSICEFIDMCKFNIFGILKEPEFRPLVEADYIKILKIPLTENSIERVAGDFFRSEYQQFRKKIKENKTIAIDKFNEIYIKN
jgi:hypothetical protein